MVRLGAIGENTVMKMIFENLYSTKLENLKEMDNFLDKYHLPKLNQEQISKLNRPITAKKKNGKKTRLEKKHPERASGSK